MKIKWFTCMVAVLFAVGISGSALAVLDLTGDEIVTGYDIEEVEVLYFDAPSPEDDSIKVNLAMEDTSGKLPGLLMFEVDVDNKASTGGTLGMPGFLKTCGSGCTTTIKQQAGFDILVMIMIRNQSADAATAWCGGCTGSGGLCFERGDACDGVCGGTDCYKPGATCEPDSGPTCYMAVNACNEPKPTCNTCYELTEECTGGQSCNIGRRSGEWYADTSVTTVRGGPMAAWGRIDMPLPKAADTVGSDAFDSYPLPWGRIVSLAHEKALLTASSPSKVFDLADGQDPANFNYQLSTWYDPDDTSPPANDLFDLVSCTPGCAEVTDVVPDAGLASVDTVKACTTGCNGDFDTDADVDGTDAVNFKADFFRKNCLNGELRCR